MFEAIFKLALTAGVERATLFANHVIAAEDEALRRLRPHAGRCIALHLDGAPAPWPVLPALRFLVTPAGLLEGCGAAPAEATADLTVRVGVADPAALAALWAAGRRPRIDIDGDAQFAADLNWLFDHLRWDAEDDLARLVGPTAAHGLARAGGALAGGLRHAAGTLARWSGTAPADDRGTAVPGAGRGAR